MIELWFVTPAYRRFELSELCLDQRRRLCEELAPHGIAATCVVVADDENLEIARAYGFEAVQRPNKWLGMKFAAGHHAALAGGATHVMPIGSDSWMHSELLLQMPFHDDACTGSTRLATLRADGLERLDLELAYAAGFGVATLYPRAAMLGERYPCAPYISRGCDTSTWNRTARERGLEIDFAFAHELEYTDFKSYDIQTTSYDVLKARHAHEAVVGDAAIDGLRIAYDVDLVDRLRAIYSGRPAWTA